MNAILATAVATLFALPVAAGAQQGGNPLADALRADLQRSQRNLVGAAEAMPADKYGFKPTPAQMSFGQLVLHVAGSNEYMCSTISGAKQPDEAKLQPTDSKDKLVARLKRSFDYCGTALASVDDSKLSETVPFFGGRTISRAGAMLDLAADWADHYGAAAVYLRLNGVLPPTAKRGEG
ncbi:MAG TPA: DinB family protein [Gemmatimonadaceae bacterium]|nr:DinB family protein [Gemmatimonadaceae bacterium]